MDLGSRLRNLRRRQKMTLEKLAKRTGLTSSFLSQVERNVAFPSVKSLREIASGLNTKVSCFFEEEGTKSTEISCLLRKTREKILSTIN